MSTRYMCSTVSYVNDMSAFSSVCNCQCTAHCHSRIYIPQRYHTHSLAPPVLAFALLTRTR